MTTFAHVFHTSGFEYSYMYMLIHGHMLIAQRTTPLTHTGSAEKGTEPKAETALKRETLTALAYYRYSTLFRES